MLVYLIAGIAALSILAGIGWKVREAGADSVRVEWAAANEKAKQEADAERLRQEGVRATQDREATRRLADARKTNAALLTSLDAHIRVAGLRADCRLNDQLLSDANSALSGGEGKRPGPVPSKP